MARVTQVRELAGRVTIELYDDADLRYLEVRSLVDVGQALLLPLPTPPSIDGLALVTRMSRLHSLPWSLAWGAGTPPRDCVVELTTGTLRFRRTVTAEPVVLDGRAWVAVVEGAFATAATVVNGVETARVALADRY